MNDKLLEISVLAEQAKQLTGRAQEDCTDAGIQAVLYVATDYFHRIVELAEQVVQS